MTADNLNPPKKKPRAEVPKVDLDSSLEELALILSQDRSLIEKELVRKGDEVLGFYTDNTIRGSYKEFNRMRIEVIKIALDDVAKGAPCLKRSTVGVTLAHGKMKIFIEQLGLSPQGTVVFSINLKTSFAFGNWRKDPTVEFPQDDLNTAIYRLAVLWAEIIRDLT